MEQEVLIESKIDLEALKAMRWKFIVGIILLFTIVLFPIAVFLMPPYMEVSGRKITVTPKKIDIKQSDKKSFIPIKDILEVETTDTLQTLILRTKKGDSYRFNYIQNYKEMSEVISKLIEETEQQRVRVVN